MTPLVLTVVLGLVVALSWGSADTLAARVSQRIGTSATTLTAQVAGLVLSAAVALALGLPALSLHALAMSVLWGIVVGAVAAVAYLTLYTALSHGPLAVASPLVSAQGGVTLILAMVVLRELPGLWQALFLAVTFAGVMLAAVNGREARQVSPRAMFSPGVAAALVSMLCFGGFVFGLGEAARQTNWLLCVVWARVFSCLLLSVFLRPDAAQNALAAPRRGLWLAGAAVVGSLDVGGLLVLARATTTGSLGVAGMVASAYGVIPLAAGIVLFKERPAMNQLAGVALLLSALVGVAAPSSPVSRLLLVVIGAALVGLGLVTLGARWLRRRAAGVPAPIARAFVPPEPSVVRSLREYVAIFGTRAVLPPSVVICGPGSARPESAVYRAAYETARRLAEAGFGLVTGDGPGIMAAGHLGARASGAFSALSGYPDGWTGEDGATGAFEVVARVTDAAPRLLPVGAAVRAVIVFPGDLSALDDLRETIRAMQAGDLARVPCVLYGSAWWRDLVAWLRVAAGAADTLALVHLCDDPGEIVSVVARAAAEVVGDPRTDALAPRLSREKENVCNTR
mgnify:CR=1 FL=1